MSHLFYKVGLLLLLCLSGCAENIREAPPGVIAKSVKGSPTPDGKGYSWRAPDLEVRHYRVTIGGFDTINYWLVASKPQRAQREPVFELWIDSNYGGSLRHYAAIKFANGSSRALVGHRHAVERCQEFSNMVNACIYQDSASVEISRTELDNAQRDGLKLTLSSGSEDYEHIDLPANYIQGFLQAVQ
jgi:hypothetical protein